MKILNLLKISCFLFVLSLFVVSCSKDPVDNPEIIPGQIDTTEETDQNSLFTRSNPNSEGLDLDCITILFPFDVIDNNDETHTINDLEDFTTIIDSTNGTYIIDFVYPLEISHEDGTTSTVENAEELGEAFANCLPNGWDDNAFPAYLINLENSCLTLQYPVTVSKLDGTTVTFDDEDSFVAALAEEPLFFVFPLSFINEEGEVIVANDIDELLTALFDCNGLDIDTTIWDDDYGFEYIGCYELTFPFSVELTDGTIVEVNDHMEYCDLLLEGNIQGYAFPLTLIGADGEEITVNSQEELDELLAACDDWTGPGGELEGDLFILLAGAIGADSIGVEGCYEISFPISGQEIDPAGNVVVVTLNSVEEAIEYITANPFGLFLNLDYPITVTLNSSGEEVILESTEDIIALLEDCQ